MEVPKKRKRYCTSTQTKRMTSQFQRTVFVFCGNLHTRT